MITMRTIENELPLLMVDFFQRTSNIYIFKKIIFVYHLGDPLNIILAYCVDTSWVLSSCMQLFGVCMICFISNH